MGSQLSRNERAFLSWIAPRGIVAAAISSLFAFELHEKGYDGAEIVVPLTLMVIVGTVVLQGGTAKWMARKLGVQEADPQGFLIMGCNQLGQNLGLALQEEGFIVRLVDTNWERVRTARMAGLEVIHGNILSEFTESQLDLGGIGRLLALTRNDSANALACQHLREELGSAGVYQIPPEEKHESETPSHSQVGRLIGNEDATYDIVEEMFIMGATMKKTLLTNEYTYAQFKADRKHGFIPLMMIRGTEVDVWTVDNQIEPQPGWTLISLLFESDDVGEEPRHRSPISSGEMLVKPIEYSSENL